MCGIHGFITGKTRVTNADDFITDGFVTGSLRGTDAAGMVSVNTVAMEAFIQKLPIPGYIFVGDKYANQLARDASGTNMITIAHTRSATAGKHGLASAHPFRIHDRDRELIGVHNGSLSPWTTQVGSKKFNVDSEWALDEIFNKGLDAFKGFQGSYCFAFWDSWDPNVINFALNKERPMHIVFTENGSMAFASEPGMLVWLCERNRIKMESEVKALMPDQWYRFDVDDPSKYTKEALPARTVIQHQSSTYHDTYGTRGNYSTVMSRVSSLAARITANEQDPVLPVPARTSLIVTDPLKEENELPDTKFQPRTVTTAEEVLKAKDTGWMNTRGTFQPVMYDEVTDTVHGTFYKNGAELDAIIRNALRLKFEKDDLWICTVIGVQDDGEEMGVVCGWPTRKVPVMKSAAA